MRRIMSQPTTTLTFSRSVIAEFDILYYQTATGKCYGQAFYDHMELHKITGPNKDWCDYLYNADTMLARKMVLSCAIN